MTLPASTESRTASPIAIWAPRLLLAALFLTGAQVLLWLEPLQRPLTDWLILIAGAVALATITLDLMVRFRVRDVYDVMVVTVVYAVSSAFLLDPTTALIDFPFTFITRVMGAHTLISFEMLALFLALTAGQFSAYRRFALMGAVIVGFAWGVWVHWSPELTPRIEEPVTLATMFIVLGVAMIVIAGLYVMTLRVTRKTQASDYLLSPLGWAVMAIVLIVIFLVRAANETLVPGALLPIIGVIAVCVGIIWSRSSNKGRMLLNAHFPPTAPPILWVIMPCAVFVLMTAFVYDLPLVELAGFNQLTVIEFAFAVVGFGWLPFVAAITSTRAIARQYQRLDF